MFQDIANFDDYIYNLHLHEILFQHVEGFSGDVLYDEKDYDTIWSEIHSMCDEVIYLEDYEHNAYFLRFYELTEFYSLCREHSRRNHINFRKNPHVLRANRIVAELLDSVHSRSFQWNLWVPKKLVKKRKDTLLIEPSCYFDEERELLEALYCIREYYAEQMGVLKAELSATIIPLPLAQEEERKAA